MIHCSDDQANYIGDTGRNLPMRLTEHKRDTKKGDLNNNIAEHHLKTNHDWDSATCLTYSTDYYQRITLESWFTNLEQTALNRCQPLPAPYKRLLNSKPCLLFILQSSSLHNLTCLHSQSHHAFTNGYSIYWPIKSLTRVRVRVLNFQLTNSTTWLWRHRHRSAHRLSKRQSLTTVLLRTPITQMIFFNQGSFLMFEL